MVVNCVCNNWAKHSVEREWKEKEKKTVRAGIPDVLICGT